MATDTVTEDVLKVDRRRKDRRGPAGETTLKISTPDGEERREGDRRRQIDPTTCERDYSEREIEFMRAMDEYKRNSGRMFPTWSEVLEVMHCMGYRQVAEPTELIMK